MGKLDTAWRKSSYSGANGGNCVEVAVLREAGACWCGTPTAGPVSCCGSARRRGAGSSAR